MQIECVMSQTVPYQDRDGSVNVIALRPGKHNYPMLHPKTDPLLADTLRVLRKHSKVRFDDLLPSDVEVLKDKPDGVEPVEYLAEKVLLKPSPVGRGPSKVAKKAKKAKKAKDARRNKKNQAPAPDAVKKTGDGGQPGGVSNKK